MRCDFAHITFLTGTMLILSSASFAAPSPAKTQDPSVTGARLLKNVAADARQIQSAALELNKMTKDPASTWMQYDRKWNEIQPVVEAMQMKIARLEDGIITLCDRKGGR